MSGAERHLVVVHRYFEPDTPPYAAILGDLVRHLGARDQRVTVLTCQPSYNRASVSAAPSRETVADGVEVVRWPVLDDRASSWKKVVNLLWFCGRLLLAARGLGRVDVMMAATTPPVLVAAVVARIARSKGAAFVYHKQDIYPEVAARLSRGPGLLHHVLRAVDTRTDRMAAQVVVLSRDMAATVARRGVDSTRVVVINNFDPWQVEAAPARSKRPDPAALKIAFAGNLGRFQGLEMLFAAVRQLEGEPVQFHFFGQGALQDELEKLVARGRSYVFAHGYQPPSEVARFLANEADLGVVSLAPGVIDCAYPSKTLSYLRQGTPILAVVESFSELADLVRVHRIGIQVEPGDEAGLVDTLRLVANDPQRLVGASERMRRLHGGEFSRESRLDQWDQLFAAVSA